MIKFCGAGCIRVNKKKNFYEQHNLQLNISKAKKFLKWYPNYNIRDSVRNDLEELFYNNNVTIEFWAHEHSYERTCPLYKGMCFAGLVLQLSGDHLFFIY